MVRILPFQGRGPGSIPGWRIFLTHFQRFCICGKWVDRKGSSVLILPTHIHKTVGFPTLFKCPTSLIASNRTKWLSLQVTLDLASSARHNALLHSAVEVRLVLLQPAHHFLQLLALLLIDLSLLRISHLHSIHPPISTSEITSASLLISLSTPLFSLFTCFSNSRLRICSLFGCSTFPGTKSCSYEGAFH